MRPFNKVLTQEQVQESVRRLAENVDVTPDTVVSPVLTGGMWFAVDLMRAAGWSLPVLPLMARSYVATKREGPVQLGMVDATGFKGKRVLLVEDILDTGETLKRLTEWLLLTADAGEVHCVALLSKDRHRKVEGVTRTWVGHQVHADQFVVGYGLDLDGDYRLLPDIWEVG
jgi:hypoxanthine phosphoribosyltransferase